jgi:hypothetical protein
MPVWVRRSRLGMVSPDSQATASCRQADTPLIVLFRFPGPALSACVLVVAFCAVMLAGCDYTGRVSTVPRTAKPAGFFDIVSHIDTDRSTFVLICFGTSYPVATFSQYANNWISSIEKLKGTGTGKRDERQRRDGAQEGVFIHEQPIKQFLRPFCLRAKKRA